MKKKELIGRWESDTEWITKRKEIQSALVSTKGQSEYVNIDLRGIKIAETDRHCPWVKAKVFEGVDFSYADFSRCRLDRCTFRNCTFNYVNLSNITEVSCEFLDCVFYKGKMNGLIGVWESHYKNVVFDQIRLSSLRMSYPDFENCKFENCNLKRTEFNGAILNHVQFIGLVSDVKFRGRYILRNVTPPEDFDAGRMYQLNPMIVDFSKAEITYSMFTDACDLTRVILPEDGKHYLIRNKIAVKEYAGAFCESLKEEEKKYLERILDVFLFMRTDDIMDIINLNDWYNSMTKNEEEKKDAKIILDRLINELKDKDLIAGRN